MMSLTKPMRGERNWISMPTITTVGDEVGRVGDHLHRLLEAAVQGAVERQGQQDRERKPGGQRVQADLQRVAHHAHEVGRVEELLEVLEADPLAAPDPLDRQELPERDLGAVHRDVQ